MAPMNIIPNKNLFIVTSALKPNMGVINDADRYTQTIDTLKNLRERCPDDYIFFTDGSPNQVEQEKLDEIGRYADIVSCWSQHPDIFALASSGRKSESEVVLLFHTLALLKTNVDLMKMLQSVQRIFKYSARSSLHDSFDIKEYDNLFGKYVFKKAIPSWLPPEKKRQITDHLYITRMYSFCPSLLDDYIGSLQSIYNTVVTTGADTEHAHYKEIDANLVIAKETLHCDGIIAGTGKVEQY